MRLLVDATFSPQLISLLGDAGHDVTHVFDLGLGTRSDETIMARALSEQRAVVTASTEETPLPFGLMDHPPLHPTAEGPGGYDPSSEVFNRLLRNRIVFLGTDVNDHISNIVTAQLLYLEAEDQKKDIWLYINSPGGSVTAGMAIYDTMQLVQPDVGTICMGLGASMGQFLLCAGAPKKRFALPHARVMMHQPSGGFRGQASDIAIQAEQMMYVKNIMAQRIADHTGQTVEQVQLDSDRDRWFTADEAKAYGIIDEVIERRDDMT